MSKKHDRSQELRAKRMYQKHRRRNVWLVALPFLIATSDVTHCSGAFHASLNANNTPAAALRHCDVIVTRLFEYFVAFHRFVSQLLLGPRLLGATFFRLSSVAFCRFFQGRQTQNRRTKRDKKCEKMFLLDRHESCALFYLSFFQS